ncbi:MAG: response regulator [Dehalococcoidales bacterium]|nr:MAG: response regulator [Dehalococcoidales bacterium]
MTTRGPQILIVDDEPYMRRGLRRVLEKEGYEVTTAPDGETALKIVSERKPEAVLLDIMMPGMDGREVCRRIREIATTVQVIYITARAEPNDPMQSKQLRDKADAFITKPATSKTIISTVNGLLRNTHQQPEKPQLCRTGQLTKAGGCLQNTEAGEDDRKPIR